MKMTMMMSSISSGGWRARAGDDRDINITIYSDPAAVHSMMSRQMQDVFRMFNGVFGDVGSMFSDEHFEHFGSVTDIAPDTAPQEGSIRDHYLKPGYNLPNSSIKEDVDLDGKVSSEEIAGLLKRKDPYDSLDRPPESHPPRGGPMFQTIITKSITKPDGTVETRRVVKDHLGNVEETLTTTQIDSSNPRNPLVPEPFSNDNYFKSFASFWKIF